ncbi:unnamed protein product, partial [marine sediment metagenome]
AVSEEMLAGAAKFLKDRLVLAAANLRFAGQRERNVRGWMLFALARLQPTAIKDTPKVVSVLDNLYAERDELSDYGRALLAITLAELGQVDRARTVVENLENTAQEDLEAATVCWARKGGWWYWWHDDVETTAMALRALLRTLPEHRYVNMAANWLVQNRRGSKWYSTKQTALAIYALLEYAKRGDQLVPDMKVNIALDDLVSKTVRITKVNLLDHDARLALAGQEVPVGFHELSVERQGKGLLDTAGT